MILFLALVAYALAWAVALLRRSRRIAITRETASSLLGLAACLGMIGTAQETIAGLAGVDRLAAHPLNVLPPMLSLLGAQALALGLGVGLLRFGPAHGSPAPPAAGDAPTFSVWCLAGLALSASALVAAELLVLATSRLWWLIMSFMMAGVALAWARGWLSLRRAAVLLVAVLWLPLGWSFLCVAPPGAPPPLAAEVPASLAEMSQRVLAWSLARVAQLMLILHAFAAGLAGPRWPLGPARPLLVAVLILEAITVGELAHRWATSISHGSVEGWLIVVLDMVSVSVIATAHAVLGWIVLAAVARSRAGGEREVSGS